MPLTNSGNPVGNEKALTALECVNERASHLALTIKRSLSLLPNSPVSLSPFFISLDFLFCSFLSYVVRLL
jgi:hypothetical protein